MLDARYVVGYLMKVMGKLSADYGFKKVYIINQDVLWANGIGNGMKKWFEKNNWEVTGHDAYPTGATDFSTSLIKAKKSGAQVMLPIFDMSSSGILILQWREMRVPALPVGFISPLMGSETTTTFGDAINGVVNIIFQGGNIPLKKYEPATRFYEAYKKRWGKELQSGHMPSEAYDSVYVLAKAIEKAGSLDKDLLIKALEETDHQGSIGRIRMKDHQYVFGENPAENAILVVYQWKKGGKRVPVFPDSISEGPISKPEWVK